MKYLLVLLFLIPFVSAVTIDESFVRGVVIGQNQCIICSGSSGGNISGDFVKRIGDNMTGNLDMRGASLVLQRFDGVTFGSIGAVGSALRISSVSNFAFSGFANETQLAFNDLSYNITTFFNSLNRANALRIDGETGTNSLNASIVIKDNVTINSLTGVGNAYACINSTGGLYRSSTVCV